MNPQQPVWHEDLLCLLGRLQQERIWVASTRGILAPCMVNPSGKNLTYYNALVAAIQYETGKFSIVNVQLLINV
jgi:hypothetical protein